MKQVPKFLFLFCFSLSCGSSLPRIPANGELGGQKIETTVDSPITKYYLENYLRENMNKNPEFHNRIERVYRQENSILPTSEYLRSLSDQTSVDFATIYWAKRVLENKANRSIYLQFKQQLSKTKIALSSAEPQLHPNTNSYVFLFVPGWVYESEKENGADFANPRKILNKVGLESHLLEIEETGTLEENAAYVANEIIRYNHSNKNLILVSASSGGPAVLQAVGALLEPSQLMNVRAWVNIGGLLQGSFLADSAVRWPKRWLVKVFLFFKGWDYDSIESMTTKRSRQRFDTVSLPQHVFYLNYVGIPLSGHITKRAKDGYMDMRKHGPNDGLTLLTDELIPNSMTIAELGLDHFYLDPEIDLKTVALARLVIDYLENL